MQGSYRFPRFGSGAALETLWAKSSQTSPRSSMFQVAENVQLGRNAVKLLMWLGHFLPGSYLRSASKHPGVVFCFLGGARSGFVKALTPALQQTL
jgi:hypothetical protein